MNLTQNSWHRKFYDASIIRRKTYTFENGWGLEPINNFCDYFWTLVLSIILLPFTWPMYILQHFTKEPIALALKFVGGAVVQMLFIMLTYAIMTLSPEEFLNGTLMVLGVLVGVALVVVIIYFFSESKQVAEISNIISEGVKSKKNKYCPKITWK